MFTGLVKEIGVIESKLKKGGKTFFNISCKSVQKGLTIGESISCNGICLTVVNCTNDMILVETMNQTIEKTTAKNWNINTSVHLENALCFLDKLNGHLVQGHIDCVTKLSNIYIVKNTHYLVFSIPNQYSDLVIEHGSICIDGVSLTIAKLSFGYFEVALIEHTIKSTHFNKLKIGALVNIEFDIIGKYVKGIMKNTRNSEQDVNLEWAKDNGYA